MSRRLALLGMVIVALAGCANAGSGRASAPSAGADAPVDRAAEQRAIAAAGLPECPRIDAAAGGADGAAGSGGRLPAITLDCLGAGPAVTLSELPAAAGRPMVLNVWASWCTPCAAEMPRFVRAADAYAGRVDVLGIDILDDRVAALEWASEVGVNFPSLSDHDGVVRTKLPIPGPPVTFLVSGDGRLVHTEYGEIGSDAELTGLISQHLGVSA
ncbi:MAG TPA: TlpA disulfide reductase family protein [Actinomycetes bacterium]|nr:TlpA disulfide reductase family protein [Actinomycetes bacterium]